MKSTIKYAEEIQRLIHVIRNQRVILDADLARVYGVTTKRLNEQVKRNAGRFPDDFAFMLTSQEVTILKSQFATSSLGHGGKRKRPWVFTEHGALMAANVLNSSRAVAMSVYVIRAFVRLRETVLNNLALQKRLAEIENTLLVHDDALRELYEQIRPLLLPPPDPPPKQIGFHARERRARYMVRRK